MAENFSLTAQLHLQAPKNVKQVFNQIQAQLKGATVDIEVKQGTKAVKDLNKVASATKQVQKESKGAATAANSMGAAFGSALKNVLRYDLARRVFSAFANTLEQGTKDAISFQREMIKISQVSGQTMKQLQGLQRTITSLSTSLGVSSASLVKVGLILKQTGLSVQDTQLAMAALAKSELAPTFDNITDTAETAVAAMRQFSIEASQLEGLLSKINTVAANFAIEASDIGVAIKRAGGAFKAAGGSVEELIALMTSVRSTTRETAETIATGFRTIFTRLQRPTTIKFLRQFGIELTDLNGKFVGPYEAVKRLSVALKGLSSQDLRFSTIVEQLGGFRQVSKVIPLIQQFGTAQEALNAQLSGSGSLAKDAATAQQSLAVQMQKVTENVKEMFRIMVDSDAFKTIASLALKLANAITQIGKALAPVLPILGAFVAARAAAWAGGKLFGGGLGGLNKAMGSAGGGTTDMFRGNRGGRVRRFSGGGWVPGSGNGDTVPAMLEPGEFVLRKSAAQSFGSKLNGINKYQDGGRAKNVAAAQLKYKSTTDGDSLNVDFVPRQRWQNSSSRLLGYDAYEKGGPDAKTKGDLRERTLGNYATKAMDTYIKGKSAKQIKHMFDEGDAFASKKMKYGRLPFRAGSFGASLTRQGLAVKGEDNRATGGLGKKIEKWAEMELKTEGSANYPRTGPATRDYEKWVRERANRLRRERQKAKATNRTSKKVPLASGGMVPSLLTPGEFVVNKKSAQSFGYGKLRSMNKYAGGGTVQKFGGGDMVGGGGAMGSMMNLAFMKSFKDSTVSVTKGLYQAGEGAVWAYTKMQFMAGAVNAIGTQLGMGGKTLDAFTGLLGQSLGILGAFNAALKSETIMRSFDLLGGKVKGLGSLIGRLSGKAGGTVGKIGTNISKGNFGLFASKVTKQQGIVKGATHVQGIAQRRVIADSAKFAARAKKMKTLGAEAKSLLGPRGGQPRGVGAAAKKLRLKEIKGSLSGLKGHQTRAKTAIKAAAGAAKSQGKAAVQAGKAAKMFKALNVAGFVATYAVGKLGSAIEKGALDEIKKGGAADYTGMFGSGEKGIARKAAVGGALKGAATGAAIGMIFGPWGAAIGAATGALIGYVIALKNAEREIKAAKFRKAVEKMSSVMEDFAEGSISSVTALQTLSRQSVIMEENQGAVSVSEAMAANSALRKNTLKLAKAAADGSSSVSEFNARIASSISRLKEKGFIDEANLKQMRLEVAERKRVQDRLAAHVAAVEKSRRELERLVGLAGAMQEVENRLRSFGDVIKSISNPTGSTGIGQGTSNLLIGKSQDIESILRFEKAIDSFGNIAGERKAVGLSEQGQNAKEMAFLSRNIESVLTRASEKTGLSGSRAQDEIMKQIGIAWRAEFKRRNPGANEGDAPEFGKNLTDHINKILGGFSEEDLADIKGNVDKFRKDFDDGSDTFLKVYRQAGDILDNHLKRLASAYDERRGLELSYIKQQKSLLKQRQDAEQEYLDNISIDKFSGISNDKVQQNFNERQRLALSGAGKVEGLGSLKDLPLTVSALKKELLETGKALDISNKGLAKIGTNAEILMDNKSLLDSTSGLIDANDKLKKRYSVLEGVLQAYANSQQRLIALNRELQQAQQKQKSLRQLAEQARFGTAEEKASAKNIINAVMVAIKAGSIDAVRPELQRQVLALLPQVAGKEGQAIIDKDLNRSFAPFGGGRGITSASAEQERVSAEIQTIRQIGIEAGAALAAETARKLTSFESVIEGQNQAFLTALRALFEENFKRQQQLDVLQKTSELQELQANFVLLTHIAKVIGSTNKEDVNNARDFVVNRSKEQQQNRKTVNDSMSVFGNLKNDFTKSSAGGWDNVLDYFEDYATQRVGSAMAKWDGESGAQQLRVVGALADSALGVGGTTGYKEHDVQMARARVSAERKKQTGGRLSKEEQQSIDEGYQYKGSLILANQAKRLESIIGGYTASHMEKVEAALDESWWFKENWEMNAEGKNQNAVAGVLAIKKNMREKAVEGGLFQDEEGGLKAGDQFNKIWDDLITANKGTDQTFAQFYGQLMNELEEIQQSAIEDMHQVQNDAKQLGLPSNFEELFDDAQLARLETITQSLEDLDTEMTKRVDFVKDSVYLEEKDKKLLDAIVRKRQEYLDLMKKEKEPKFPRSVWDMERYTPLPSEAGAKLSDEVKPPGFETGAPKTGEEQLEALMIPDAAAVGEKIKTMFAPLINEGQTTEEKFEVLKQQFPNNPEIEKLQKQFNAQQEEALQNNKATQPLIGPNNPPAGESTDTSIGAMRTLTSTVKMNTYAAQTMQKPKFARQVGGYYQGKNFAGDTDENRMRDQSTTLYRTWQDRADRKMLEAKGYNPNASMKKEYTLPGASMTNYGGGGYITEVGGKKLETPIKQVELPSPADADKYHTDGLKALQGTHGILKSEQGDNSFNVYDKTSEGLLNQMLEVMKGEGGGTSSNSSFIVDTRALDDSVQKFSQSIGQLAMLMGNPLGITVGGTITMDVKLNGAEWFRDAESSLTVMAGQQVTQGINNFIRNGLKDSRILTNPDWVNDSAEVGVPMNNNTSGLA